MQHLQTLHINLTRLCPHCTAAAIPLNPLQKEHKGVIALLKAASDQTRARFKDIQFQRNKRRKAAAASTALHSRSWYLPVNSWITGTTTLQEASEEQPEQVRCGAGMMQRLAHTGLHRQGHVASLAPAAAAPTV